MQEHASHIPLPDSDTSLSEVESEVELLSSQPLGSSNVYVDVQSWLPEPSKDSILGLGGTLVEAILALFTPLARHLADGKNESVCPIDSKGLFQDVERFFLWGNSFSASSGQLDEILSRSSELRQSVFSSLYELGLTLKNTALQTCCSFGSSRTKGLDVPMRELQSLLEQTSILLYGSDALETSDDISESGSSTSDLDEYLEDISTYIDCLMDLSVALENPVYDVETVDATIPILQDLETFDVSSSQALAFCRKIRDRFPKLETWLVERLGENNALRASALKEARECCLDIEAMISEMAKWAIDEPEQSVLLSEALFSDGQPKPTEATRSTNLSDSVFDKSNPDSFGRLAPSSKPVPPLPEEALEGKPFSCLACHQTIAVKMSRKDWKRHIFADLSPYACTVQSFTLETKLYSSTRSWVEHEAQHRPQDWQGSECPFCNRNPPPASSRSYYKHVAEHLREVSLAALPHGHDSDAEDSDSDVESEDGDDWATVSDISETRETGPISEPPRKGKRKRSDEVADKDPTGKSKEKRERRQKPRETAKANPPLTNQERAELFMSLVTKGPDSERGSSLNKIMKRFHRARKTADVDTTKMVEAKELWRNLRLRQNDRGEIVLFSAEPHNNDIGETADISRDAANVEGSSTETKAARCNPGESVDKEKME